MVSPITQHYSNADQQCNYVLTRGRAVRDPGNHPYHNAQGGICWMLGTATCCPGYFRIINHPTTAFTSVLELPRSEELCPNQRYTVQKKRPVPQGPHSCVGFLEYFGINLIVNLTGSSQPLQSHRSLRKMMQPTSNNWDFSEIKDCISFLFLSILDLHIATSLLTSEVPSLWIHLWTALQYTMVPLNIYIAHNFWHDFQIGLYSTELTASSYYNVTSCEHLISTLSQPPATLPPRIT